MANRKILDRVTALARGVVESQGLALDRIELHRSGRAAVLRVFVDKEGGVTVEDCRKVSEELSVVLDVEDPIESAYTLEVSSPGLDRPLVEPEDFRRFAGRLVRMYTYGPVEGRREFLGTLRGIDRDTVRIEDRSLGREVPVPLSAISKAHLEIEF